MRPPLPAPRPDAWPTPTSLQARGLRLRALGDHDESWLRELYASTRVAELAPVPWPDAAKRAFLDQQFDLQHRHFVEHFADADFLAVEHAGACVGRLYLDRSRADWLIVDIALVPALRGRGIGGALVAAVQADAGAHGHGVELHVALHNHDARRLYERVGFVPIETSATHLLMRWRPSGIS